MPSAAALRKRPASCLVGSDYPSARPGSTRATRRFLSGADIIDMVNGNVDALRLRQSYFQMYEIHAYSDKCAAELRKFDEWHRKQANRRTAYMPPMIEYQGMTWFFVPYAKHQRTMRARLFMRQAHSGQRQ